VAQGVEPEFRPQYCKKKERTRERNRKRGVHQRMKERRKCGTHAQRGALRGGICVPDSDDVDESEGHMLREEVTPEAQTLQDPTDNGNLK
jgi:tRNA A-37 threonylcarbamoyl transferase component Bud32